MALSKRKTQYTIIWKMHKKNNNNIWLKIKSVDAKIYTAKRKTYHTPVKQSQQSYKNSNNGNTDSHLIYYEMIQNKKKC